MMTNSDSLTLGVQASVTDQTMPLPDLVKLVDERHFGALFIPEHTHAPITTKIELRPSPTPTSERYKRYVDPFVALGYAAGQTETMELGTGVSLVLQHDPISLAKQIATLDYLSNGRFVYGIGFGWNRPAYEHHQKVPFERRVDLTRETVAFMRALWTDVEASYSGEFLTLNPSWAWPKPGRVPILLGARPSIANFERISTWADGWIAPENNLLDDGFPTMIAQLREAWERQGREPGALDITVIEVSGSYDHMARCYEAAARNGVGRLLMNGHDRPKDTLAPILDDLVRVRSQIGSDSPSLVRDACRS
jgi:probable F420-dependent oxidoreductase